MGSNQYSDTADRQSCKDVKLTTLNPFYLLLFCKLHLFVTFKPMLPNTSPETHIAYVFLQFAGDSCFRCRFNVEVTL